MRARNLKPSLFSNEILGQADPLLTILFQGLWCIADREGLLEDRPLRIKAEIFPYREGLDVNGLLTDLERLGFILRYESQQRRLISVIKFLTHQNPHHTEKLSVLPKPAIVNGCLIPVNQPLSNGEYPADSPFPPTDPPLSNGAAPSAPLLPEVVNGKSHPKGRKSKKFEIPGLGFSPEMEAEFNRIWEAWPSQGWNFTSKAPSPRRINRALAMRRFKEILDNCPHEIDKRRIAASDLVDSALAFIAKRKAESPGAIPNVPCIANFFSSEEVSKKQWQDALMEFFGETV